MGALAGFDELDGICVNTIRNLAVDAVEQARSGHAGLPLGAAPMAYVLWRRHLRFNPRNPAWAGRDRFVLSAGHGSMLLYALLHLTGYDLSLDELKRFRQWGSRTPGHPEHGLTPGVETTTGPLGQGFANGVGMALAATWLAARYARPGHDLFDQRVYAICSDGDLMEGVSSEAASLAGHLRLGRLVYLYDDNRITIDGGTDLAFGESVLDRFGAYGWHTQRVEDGTDLAAIDAAITAAEAEAERPSIIAVRTVIGYGMPRQGTNRAHSDPMGPEETAQTKRNLGWPADRSFYVPDDALGRFREAVARGAGLEADWEKGLQRYAQAFPQEAGELQAARAGRLPDGWLARLPHLRPADGPLATRQASGQVLNALAPAIPTLLGGSADLTGSNDTQIKGEPAFGPEERTGRNLHFGVREHGMGAILNGMALFGGLHVYGGTFLTFSDYMRPAIRLAALMRLPVVFVFTHDSIGLGEDGPTHQPIAQVMALRAIPDLTVIRPADANETAAAWVVALQRQDGPVALALSRQKLPVLEGPADVARGGYVLVDAGGGTTDVVLIGTGSEVSLCLAARERLAAEGLSARVVSLPSWELFAAQPEAYRSGVLPPGVPRVSVEAGVTLGWERYADASIGVDRFGASAPGDVVLREYGFTPEHVAEVARACVRTASSMARPAPASRR